ncbi:STAS domain-containing protein [Streptomyces sp. RGM 3693]|uniref:STAS domain-containing protein n=1 Tax=Streptomyces sp. RGM 3693 TaxID=3413284 RepID=UPI003D266F3E
MPHTPRTVVWHFGPSIATTDVPALCTRLDRLLRARPRTTVLCDVRAVTAPDTATVQALLRLQLTARRLGGPGIRLWHVPEALGLLLAATGLNGALPSDDGPPPDAYSKAVPH